MLFVVVAGLTHTGVLQWIVKHLLGQPSTYSKAVVRLMLPVAALSSFLSRLGLRGLLKLKKESAAKGGNVVLSHVGGEFQKILTMTGFIKLFDIK